MDAKFYIKSLNNSPNGGGYKRVEGNSKGLFTIYNTPSYVVVGGDRRKDIISIDDLIENNIFYYSDGLNGFLLYKDLPETLNFIELKYIDNVLFPEYSESESVVEKFGIEFATAKSFFSEETFNKFKDYYCIKVKYE